MRVLVALEHRFLRGLDGGFYAAGPAAYRFWRRYLEIFEEVVVLARVGTCAQEPICVARADGPGVTFWPLSDYVGPLGYVRRVRQLRVSVMEAVDASDAYVLRVPGLIGRLAAGQIQRLGRPYGVEVVGDPWDALGPGSIRGCLRPLYRRVAARNLRALCGGAIAAAYVTRESLQRRYPSAQRSFVTNYSDADLSRAFAGAAELQGRRQRLLVLGGNRRELSTPVRIGFVGSLAQLYKGPDTLLRAAEFCLRDRMNLEVELVGDGRFRPYLEALARGLGLERRVRFLGYLPAGEPIYQFLDSVTLLVMPSRTEGLPRALLEAMARGCPCIGSMAGGIPELLPEEDLVMPGDPQALAGKIVEVTRDPARMVRMSIRNFEKAGDYNEEKLSVRRRAFYGYLKERTAASLKQAVAR